MRTYPEGGGTRVAAHLAGLPSPAPGSACNSVAPLRLPGLLEYQANWRHRLEENYERRAIRRLHVAFATAFALAFACAEIACIRLHYAMHAR